MPYIHRMAHEVHGLREFYGTPTGAVTARLLRERLRALWPRLRGMSVLGIGHAGPFLRLWRDEAERTIALTPAQLGLPARWPAASAPRPAGARPARPGAPRACAVAAEEDALPFPDLFFDRVLLVHGLENAENTRRLLREVWRVLRDDGRLMVVAPNRRGLWAHSENTPFGHGQPFTHGQLDQLLARQLFRVERRDSALFVPPFRARLLLRTAPLWEGVGRALAPRFAGVALVEAEKDVLAALPAAQVVSLRRRVVMPVRAALSGRQAARTAPEGETEGTAE
ncbi:class I SAM-dependent methyltransferase [Roseomonas acroporae]|uniref:class I SAM-dependent methyltransferase n=1 Tax=Roseomonas acroporae TaxID=2937791 RepID=UPI0024A62AA4|nr:methyltransferase domain-containing protein [Roseomonas acroporae]